MSEFRARIGRVRMKNGGADIHVFRARDPGVSDAGTQLLKHAREIVETAEDDRLVGHILVGLFSSGKTSTGFRYDPETFPVPRALFPVWFADILRRELITRSEAIGVFEEMFK